MIPAVISSKPGALAPLSIALPDPPLSEDFTEWQWNTLLAIMDAVVPSVGRGAATTDNNQHSISEAEYTKMVEHLQKNVVEAPNTAALDAYLLERPSDNPRFQSLLKRTLVVHTSETARRKLSLVLFLLT
jgi:hypothetical protein